MPARSPLWPAQVDHIRIDALDPLPVVDFYRDALGMAPTAMQDGTMLMQAPDRRILIGQGAQRSQPFTAFRMQTPRQVAQMRSHIESRGVGILTNPTPLFGSDAFAVADPDGRLIVFGMPRADLQGVIGAGTLPAAGLHGRLQHVVVATPNLNAMLGFYEE